MLRMPSAPYILARLSRVRLRCLVRASWKVGYSWLMQTKPRRSQELSGMYTAKGSSVSAKKNSPRPRAQYTKQFFPRKERMMGEDKQLQVPACNAHSGCGKAACEAALPGRGPSARPGLLADQALRMRTQAGRSERSLGSPVFDARYFGEGGPGM